MMGGVGASASAAGSPPSSQPGRTGRAMEGTNMRRETMIGLILIALGALFLLGRVVDTGRFAWPLFVLVPGVALLAWAFVGRRDAAGLAVPGSIVTMVGLILFIQNLTNTFETWSYAWALVVASVGVGTWLYGVLSEHPARQRDGIRTATIGLALFAGFGIFFQFIIFGDFLGTWLGQWLLPLALIAAGAYLLYQQRSGSA